MSNRINKEREAKLQPKRVKYAIERIQSLGFVITYQEKTKIQFEYKGETVTLYAYSGWHTGKTIQDGRGIEKLLNQIKSV